MQTVFGTVVEEQKNYYIVSTPLFAAELRCTLKGTLLKKKQFRLSCGDNVNVQIINNDTAEGVICEILPRKNFLPRPPLANLSQVIFINTFKHPKLDTEAIDRFLFSASVYELDAVIVFNKMDLLSESERSELENVAKYYRDINYKIIYASAVNRLGLDEIVDVCGNKTSAFTGLSGVGKSSLLSLIFPHVEFKTSEVSGTHGRGTHTTTHIKLLPHEKGGFIADTPGFAFIDVPKVPRDSVAAHFPEIEKITGRCKFNNCVHDAEPDCEVVRQVDAGNIAPFRHAHYLKMFYAMPAF